MGENHKIAVAALFAVISSQALHAAEEQDLMPPPVPVMPAVRLAPPAPLAPAGNAQPPKPITPPNRWIGEDDYLPIAVRNGTEGTVPVRLTVDPEGFVSGCRVLGTSGSALLDAYTCELLPERARFEPARDRDGNPTVGYWSTRVIWRMPPRPPADEFAEAPHDLIVSYSFEMGEDGAVSRCRLELASERTRLRDICPRAARIPPIIDKDGNPVRKRVTVTLTTLLSDPDEPETGE
ncbi:energy transducer TonB [Erythrobacter sp. SG61-1L]|uniref:energy transducer TonB n=1 Tax=Erythrobacter sp. SG61-1L TaxID=1603897 RepID=UPI000A7A1581|nr:energy transducer TonB [Erythrobacter sp. SG61-1L]